MLKAGFRKSIRPLAASAALGATGYAVYSYSDRMQKTDSPASGSTFSIPIRLKGPDGRAIASTRSISYLAKDDVERKLTENAFSTSVPRSDGLVWKYDTAYLASNDPIEDANAQAVVGGEDWPPHAQRSASPTGDMLFFAVMDGHGGFFTSRLLAKTLIPSVALELSTLLQAQSNSNNSKTQSLVAYLKSFIWTPSPSSGIASIPSNTSYPYDADPTYVKTAIQTAFARLDSEIVNTPIKLVEELSKSKLKLDKDSEEFQVAVGSLLPALSGACALLAVLDTAKKELYVACTGDSRAVAGYWDEDGEGNGKWRVEVLSEDQTGRNPNELRRMQSEHPVSEASYVIQRGRVLGGLEPTRAFGDARYKWSRDFQQKVADLLDSNGTGMRRIPPDLKTPPYVTCRPEITHRKLTFLDDKTSSSKSNLKFIVLATDGLWDQLSSSEVVSLVGEHLRRSKLSPTQAHSLPKSITKQNLADTTVVSTTASGIDGKSAQLVTERDKNKLKGSWAFVDSNIGTHLIRNAFGGADEEQLSRLLSIPAPMSRNFRDDLTVTVVWYDQDAPVVKAKL